MIGVEDWVSPIYRLLGRFLFPATGADDRFTLGSVATTQAVSKLDRVSVGLRRPRMKLTPAKLRSEMENGRSECIRELLHKMSSKVKLQWGEEKAPEKAPELGKRDSSIVKMEDWQWAEEFAGPAEHSRP